MNRPTALHVVTDADTSPAARAARARAELAACEAEMTNGLIDLLNAARREAEALGAQNSIAGHGAREFARNAAPQLEAMAKMLSALIARA